MDFIVESISYVDDAPGRLELAIQDFNNLDWTKHTDCLLLFSDMQTLINNCITWMGKPHMTDWQLAEHFLKICPQHVRAAWNEFESQPMTRSVLTLSNFRDTCNQFGRQQQQNNV